MNTAAIRNHLLALNNDYSKRIDTDIHHKSEPVEKDFSEQATQSYNDDLLLSLGIDADRL